MMHSIAAHSMSSSFSLFSLSTWRRASLSVLCFVFRLSAFFISFGNDLVSCFDDFLSQFKHAMLENICLQVSHESFLGWALFCLLWNIATWRTFPFSTQSKSWGKFYTYLSLLFLQMAETSDQNQEMILIKRGLVMTFVLFGHIGCWKTVFIFSKWFFDTTRCSNKKIYICDKHVNFRVFCAVNL